MNQNELTLVAIQDWQKYLWMFRGWDANGRPCHVDPRPAGSITEPKWNHITSRHPWSNAENAVFGNEVFLNFLTASGIRYFAYEGGK